MKKLKIFLNGLIYENPTLVIFLGMCPALGTTDTIEHAIYMSLCVLAVLLLSNVIISLIRKIVPNEVRIPVYIIIIATLVSIVDMIFHAYLPYDVYQALGSFISLIVVNCIILGRAESFASKNGVVDSIFDALGYACGFAAGDHRRRALPRTDRHRRPLLGRFQRNDHSESLYDFPVRIEFRRVYRAGTGRRPLHLCDECDQK